jgi:hypothetical protein
VQGASPGREGPRKQPGVHRQLIERPFLGAEQDSSIWYGVDAPPTAALRQHLAATELIQHAFGGKGNPYLPEPTLVFGEPGTPNPRRALAGHRRDPVRSGSDLAVFAEECPRPREIALGGNVLPNAVGRLANQKATDASDSRFPCRRVELDSMVSV